ncbi:MAG TPA: CAP domain-containing protein [Actinomycetota bacterium]|jgi:uncharacterized protein YkwD|nr:CAP domain-containing protein [Actinomycetota bacterium]
MHVRSVGRRGGAAIALLLLVLLVSGFAPGRSTASPERVGRRMQMLGLTNHDRTHHDRRELDFAARLSRYAKQHSRDMAEKGYLFHSTADQLRDALDGYDWSLGGENIGVGGSLESLEDAFMASKAHRQNILRRIYDHAAFGIVRADDRIWVTVIFYG